MKLYSKDDSYTLYNDNMMNLLQDIEPCSIDSIVTDPPYELGFMGKSWDSSGVAFQKSTWQKCFEVLKPGGYMLVFGSSRTFHRIACAIEDAGFEIRDTIMWLYGSGFPKSMNIGLAVDKKNGVDSPVVGHSTNGSGASSIKLNNHEHGDTGIGYMDGSGKEFDIKQAQNEWNGYGTSLKPAYEPIIVARKPCEGSCVENVLKWGVGGINIDDCRVPFEGGETNSSIKRYMSTPQRGNNGWEHKNRGANFNGDTMRSMEIGRFPSNIILSYDDETYDEVCGGFPYTKSTGGSGIASASGGLGNNIYGKYNHDVIASHLGGLGDEGSASRYFYCAKASRRDRNEGLPEHLRNVHPTVKPVSLMQYLIRLVTPNGGTILDPFNGSGSTGKAVMWENRDHAKEYKYIGIELSEEYCEISKARIEYAEGVEYIPVDDSTTQQKSSGKITRPSQLITKKFF